MSRTKLDGADDGSGDGLATASVDGFAGFMYQIIL
jgi:hypothetical protein